MDSGADSSLAAEMMAHLKPTFVDFRPASQVASYYANRSVLVTGATGFIGKAIVEKLVRACKDIKRIYLLIRDRRGVSADDRLDELIESEIFDHIRLRRKDGREELRDKLRLVRGDITAPKFGISAEDMAELAAEVSVVFNSAATVRFTEPIEVAYENNIYSVEQLVQVCDQLAKLEAVVHISTAYSNCHRDSVGEIMYEPAITHDRLRDSLAKINEIQEYFKPQTALCARAAHAQPGAAAGASNKQLPFFDAASYSTSLLESLTEFALRQSDRPNTYTFTKSVSEWCLMQLAEQRPERYLNDKIPIAIVRPSIVGGAWREPRQGFVDNKSGPTGAIMSFYTGALQTMSGNGGIVADFVPVDMVSNAVICVAWFLANRSQLERERPPDAHGAHIRADRGIHVFNLVSGDRNPMYWHMLTDSMRKCAYKFPTKHLFRLPNPNYLRRDNAFDFWDFWHHKLPCWLIDSVQSRLLRRQLDPKWSGAAIYRRTRLMIDALTPFTNNQWSIDDSNVRALYRRLSSVDREVFAFDITQVKWSEYLDNYVVGTRVFGMNERAPELGWAVANMRKRLLLYRMFVVAMLLALAFVLFHCAESMLPGALSSVLPL